MTPAQWRLGRQIEGILAREIGLTDAALASHLKVTMAELRPVVGVLYRQRRVDLCWGYVVLSSRATAPERAA